jgi:hypothetical protein
VVRPWKREPRQARFDGRDVLGRDGLSVGAAIAPRDAECFDQLAPRDQQQPLLLVTQAEVEQCSTAWFQALAQGETLACSYDAAFGEQTFAVLE